MNLKQQLLVEHSRKNGMLVAKKASENTDYIYTLISLSIDEIVYQQRASQALAYAVEHYKVKLNEQQLTSIVQLLKNEKLHNAVHRNVLKILDLHKEYPEDIEGFLFEFCTTSIMNPLKPIAVRAFSVPVAYTIAKKYPDLKNELEQILMGLSDMESPGMQFRKKKYLNLLRM